MYQLASISDLMRIVKALRAIGADDAADEVQLAIDEINISRRALAKIVRNQEEKAKNRRP